MVEMKRRRVLRSRTPADSRTADPLSCPYSNGMFEQWDSTLPPAGQAG